MPKPNAKACLVSGPPGIGKSSSVKIIAKELGFSTLELNASDNRSKKTIEGLLKDLCTSKSIQGYQESAPKEQTKSVIIMDEVDGVNANDRGGL